MKGISRGEHQECQISALFVEDIEELSFSVRDADLQSSPRIGEVAAI